MKESDLYFKAFQEASSIKTTLMWVTPEMAGQWLEKNTHNRKTRPRGSNTYVREIKEGRWHVIHQGIAFDSKGLLVDGQHRLLAVCDAGISIPLMVTFGLPAGSMEAVDRGMKRSIPDILQLEHAIPNSSRISSLVAVIAACVHSLDTTMTPGVAMEIYRQHKPSLDWAASSLPQRGSLWAAPIVSAFAVGYGRTETQAAVVSFVASYESGEALVDGQPAFYLRRALLETDRSDRVLPKVLFRWVLNVLHRSVLGHEVTIKRGVKRDDVAGLQFFTRGERGAA